MLQSYDRKQDRERGRKRYKVKNGWLNGRKDSTFK